MSTYEKLHRMDTGIRDNRKFKNVARKRFSAANTRVAATTVKKLLVSKCDSG